MIFLRRSSCTDLPKGAAVVIECSIEHSNSAVMLNCNRGIVLASRYMIEPTNNGKSRIMHLSRVDTKGRSPEWYNKNYGFICSQYLIKIKNMFKQTTEGPDSKN